ncbi:hypothetical protein NCAST_31_00340 [Nocardia asteroides NBRC 15531]|uniref:Uncharacterized protein n=1 Tax=Nocardia asteroides NBRC 15531 TaxID=1110697 RepID=U5EG21_NOCAS|nr:hypothetical protein NCAST_31_00340 [Nocardia asteroides NBRC 15531]
MHAEMSRELPDAHSFGIAKGSGLSACPLPDHGVTFRDELLSPEYERDSETHHMFAESVA